MQTHTQILIKQQLSTIFASSHYVRSQMLLPQESPTCPAPLRRTILKRLLSTSGWPKPETPPNLTGPDALFTKCLHPAFQSVAQLKSYPPPPLPLFFWGGVCSYAKRAKSLLLNLVEPERQKKEKKKETVGLI